MSVDQVTDLFVENSNFFENATTREILYQLRAKELITRKELSKLEEKKSGIEA